MPLSDKQTGVLKGMLAAAFIALAVLIIAVVGPWSHSYSGMSLARRLSYALCWEALVILPLLLCIGMLARHRFFTPADIDGSGLTQGTDTATILQAILQNTLEQTMLAFVTQTIWAAVMPAVALGVVPAAAVMFVVGRITFALGYRHGAAARSFGFALTFYPSVMLFLSIIGHGLIKLLAG